MKSFKISDKIRGPLIIILLFLAIMTILQMSNLILAVVLFGLCLLFMFKFGAHIVFDFDPVPLSAILILYFYDHITALVFILIAVPTIDMIVGRLSHFSVINLFAIIVTVLLFGLLPVKSTVLFFGILLFNVIRIIITLMLGLGLDSALYSVIHAILYFILGLLLSFFI